MNNRFSLCVGSVETYGSDVYNKRRKRGQQAEETWFEQFDGILQRKPAKKMHLEDLPEQEVSEASAVAGGGEFGPDGFDRNGEFQGQEAMAKFFVAESVPTLFVDCIHLQAFIDLVNPLQPRVSCVALMKTAFRIFARYREELLPVFRNLKGRVSLTSSVWSDPDGDEDLHGVIYLYLNCHWIDEQWEKQSRVLGFVRLVYPLEDDPKNVSFWIQKIISKWELKDKILSVNFDGLTNIPASVSQLKRSLNPMLDGQLFHSKCAYHILNLCFEDGFSVISELVDKVRDVVDFFYVNESCAKQLKEMCINSGMKFKRLYFDVAGWNNTVYDMVDGFIRCRGVLTDFHKLEFDGSDCRGTPLTLLTEDEWSIVCGMRNFFEKFRAAFDILCSVYVPNTNLVIPLLVTLSQAFAKYRDDNHVGQICTGIESKFAGYWVDGIPMLYCLATVLDPRYKLVGLFKLLDAYNGNMKIQTRVQKSEIESLFYRTYDAYSKQHIPVAPDDLVRTGVSSGTKSALVIAHSLRNDSEHSSSSSYSEISYYLSSNDLTWSFGLEEEGDMERLDMLDVLKWWKRYEGRYPVLAAMVRDLLASASAKVPEDVFDFHSPDVNKRRREIGPRTANMCMCLKDWLRADHRVQHLFVNKEGDPSSMDEEEDNKGDGDDDDNNVDANEGNDNVDANEGDDGGDAGDDNGDGDEDEDDDENDGEEAGDGNDDDEEEHSDANNWS